MRFYGSFIEPRFPLLLCCSMDMIGFLYCLWETVVFSHSGAAMADFIEQLIFFYFKGQEIH